MNIQFEHNYQRKVMLITFGGDEPSILTSADDVKDLRQRWMKELSNWHSPYKALLDCRKLSVSPSDASQLIQIKNALTRLLKFFSGFYLKKAVVFGLPEDLRAIFEDYEVYNSEDEARIAVGLREPALPREAVDFRATILITNEFKQQSVEVGFSIPTVLETKEQINTLKQKLTNNLMQWHSGWNLIFDCANLSVKPEMFSDLSEMLRFFKGLFLKDVVGYGKSMEAPFPVYRSRHKAMAEIKSLVQVPGDEVLCLSKKGSAI